MATPALAEMSTQTQGWVGRIKPSERRLIGLLVLAALAAAPVGAFDQAQKASRRNAAAQAMLDRTRQALRRTQGGVAGQIAQAQAEVRTWSWTADNADVGKVLIQNQVIGIAEKAGLTDIEVKVADKVAEAGGVKLVSLEMTAPFSWSGLSGFLEGLEATGKGFVLDSVQLPDDDKPRLKVSLRAPLSTPPAPPAPAVAAKKAGPA